jgi:hypothetical protein
MDSYRIGAGWQNGTHLLGPEPNYRQWEHLPDMAALSEQLSGA